MSGGLFGALLYAAFGSFQCKKCGAIPKKEFPPEDRKRMVFGSVLLVVVAFAILGGAVALLVALE